MLTSRIIIDQVRAFVSFILSGDVKLRIIELDDAKPNLKVMQ